MWKPLISCPMVKKDHPTKSAGLAPSLNHHGSCSVAVISLTPWYCCVYVLTEKKQLCIVCQIGLQKTAPHSCKLCGANVPEGTITFQGSAMPENPESPQWQWQTVSTKTTGPSVNQTFEHQLPGRGTLFSDWQTNEQVTNCNVHSDVCLRKVLFFLENTGSQARETHCLSPFTEWSRSCCWQETALVPTDGQNTSRVHMFPEKVVGDKYTTPKGLCI